MNTEFIKKINKLTSDWFLDSYPEYATTMAPDSSKCRIIYDDKEIVLNCPDDIIMPDYCLNDDDVFEVIYNGFKHNLNYGGNEYILNGKENDQYKYFFPYAYDYDCGSVMVSLINLHPEPNHLYALKNIGRSTDYTSGQWKDSVIYQEIDWNKFKENNPDSNFDQSKFCIPSTKYLSNKKLK